MWKSTSNIDLYFSSSNTAAYILVFPSLFCIYWTTSPCSPSFLIRHKLYGSETEDKVNTSNRSSPALSPHAHTNTRRQRQTKKPRPKRSCTHSARNTEHTAQPLYIYIYIYRAAAAARCRLLRITVHRNFGILFLNPFGFSPCSAVSHFFPWLFFSPLFRLK